MKSIILVMLTVLSALHVLASNPAAKEYKFTYRSSPTGNLEIKQQASSQEVAFKLAAKECFKQLTGGIYPGAERGLDIIDICANPKI